MWNLKRNDTNELTKQKETHRLRKRIYGCWGEGLVRESGKVTYTLLYLKWITNKDLLHSTRTLLGVMCQPGWERGLGENGYMYTYDSVPSLFT